LFPLSESTKRFSSAKVKVTQCVYCCPTTTARRDTRRDETRCRQGQLKLWLCSVF